MGSFSLSDLYFIVLHFFIQPLSSYIVCTLPIPTGSEFLAAHERNKEEEGYVAFKRNIHISAGK
jgi:hypothetical protein